jgi:heptosyltransferase-2
MSFLKLKFGEIIKKSTKIMYPGVQFEQGAFLESEPKWKIIKRYFHRWVRLFAGGQLGLQRSGIDSQKRVLWIYNEKLNYGDAIMDMSGRKLLLGREIRVDLLTHPKLAIVFGEDRVFNKIYTDAEECMPNDYDFIILNEFNYKSIKTKIKYFRKVPFVCLFGYFIGPDRNQIEFSFAAVNDVFKLGHSVGELKKVSKPYLEQKKPQSATIESSLNQVYLTIAVGGLDPSRTYEHWAELVNLIDAEKNFNLPFLVVLLGSENGLEMERALVNTKYERIQIVSFVAKISLLESRAIIGNSALFIGADGGLMHVAHTTKAPSVTLFGGEPTYLRLTPSCNSIGIQSRLACSEISPETVMAAMKEQFHVRMPTPLHAHL